MVVTTPYLLFSHFSILDFILLFNIGFLVFTFYAYKTEAIVKSNFIWSRENVKVPWPMVGGRS